MKEWRDGEDPETISYESFTDFSRTATPAAVRNLWWYRLHIIHLAQADLNLVAHAARTMMEGFRLDNRLIPADVIAKRLNRIFQHYEVSIRDTSIRRRRNLDLPIPVQIPYTCGRQDLRTT
jgi:hypothetical protein